MRSVADVLRSLGARIPADKAAGWDPVGLQLGDREAEVTTVGVCHEVSEAVVDAVEADPPELLVTYHPLLFHPTTSLVAGRSPAGRAFRLVRAGVALSVVHTSFDAAAGGTGDALAEVLGLEEVTGFGSTTPKEAVKVVTFLPAGTVERVASAMTGAGAGTIGNYTGCSFRSVGTGTFIPGMGARPAVGRTQVANQEPETRLEMVAPAGRLEAVVAAMVAAHPYEEPAFDVYETRSNMGFVGRVGSAPGGSTLDWLAERVSETLGAGGLRVSGDPSRPIARVAVVPGSGASFIGAAAAAGADVLVSGDVSHHQAVEALDRGMAVVDPGHAPTERPGVALLAGVVRGSVPEGVAVVDLTGVDPTPWR